MHRPWTVKKILSNRLRFLRMLKILKEIPFPLQGYPTWSLHPHIHTQHTSITMTSSTSTSYHLNDIIIINIISSQFHHQHQHHLISISSSTSTSSHITIIITIHIISSQYHYQRQHHLISISSTSQAIAFHIYTYNTCLGFTFLRSLDNIRHI